MQFKAADSPQNHGKDLLWEIPATHYHKSGLSPSGFLTGWSSKLKGGWGLVFGRLPFIADLR